ncbi:MAG: hypothetical protein QM790_15615 [Nibricoccus sp.]
MQKQHRPFHGNVAFALLLLCVSFAPSLAKNPGWNADTLRGELAEAKQLPATNSSATELKFSELFQTPVGPKGLAYTEKANHLNGHRVRILGFMVRQTRPAPGFLMLTDYALTTHEGEYGLCDDLPPATVFVKVPKYADLAVPFTPGPLLLTGKLEIGPQQEADGRVSHVRLVLDAETTTTVAKPLAVSN